MPDFDVTTLDGLLAAVAAFDDEFLRQQPATLEAGASVPRPPRQPMGPQGGDSVGTFTGTFCPRCGGSRRIELTAQDDRCQHLNPRYIEQVRRRLAELNATRDPLIHAISTPPPIFTATCLQCRTRLSLIVDAGPPTEVLVLGARAPGLATHHTPPAVSFYLDQAYRARTAGALTAAAAMYRSALEQLLGDQGFTQRRLSERIDAAIVAEPPWIGHLDDELMHALRSLGNRAVHADEDDVSEQAVFDRGLVRDIEHLFLEVLDDIYELPARREARRERLRAARQRQRPQ